MRTSALVAVALLLALATGLSGCDRTAQRKADFKSVRWGASKAEAKRAQSTLAPRDGKDTDIQSFRADLLGKACSGLYFFEQDKLVQTQLSYSEKNELREETVAFFNSMVEKLTKEYGEPLIAERRWKQCGTAFVPDGSISYSDMGALGYFYWVTRRTRVDLLLLSVTVDQGWPENALSHTSEVQVIYRQTPKKLWEATKKELRQRSSR